MLRDKDRDRVDLAAITAEMERKDSSIIILKEENERLKGDNCALALQISSAQKNKLKVEKENNQLKRELEGLLQSSKDNSNILENNNEVYLALLREKEDLEQNFKEKEIELEELNNRVKTENKRNKLKIEEISKQAAAALELFYSSLEREKAVNKESRNEYLVNRRVNKDGKSTVCNFESVVCSDKYLNKSVLEGKDIKIDLKNIKNWSKIEKNQVLTDDLIFGLNCN